MYSIGRIFNRDWMLPIKSLSVRVIVKNAVHKKQWNIEYSRRSSRWCVDGSAVDIKGASELHFEGAQYFLVLASPPKEYIYEIEEISNIIMQSQKKQRTLRSIYREMKKIHGKEAKTLIHYRSILKMSKCFIQISMEDTLGRKRVIWRVNMQQLKNFRAIKSSIQTVVIETVNQKESINVFYIEDSIETPIYNTFSESESVKY